MNALGLHYAGKLSCLVDGRLGDAINISISELQVREGEPVDLAVLEVAGDALARRQDEAAEAVALSVNDHALIKGVIIGDDAADTRVLGLAALEDSDEVAAPETRVGLILEMIVPIKLTHSEVLLATSLLKEGLLRFSSKQLEAHSWELLPGAFGGGVLVEENGSLGEGRAQLLQARLELLLLQVGNSVDVQRAARKLGVDVREIDAVSLCGVGEFLLDGDDCVSVLHLYN